MNSVSHFEIIEEYPKDKYFPSYLVYSQHEENIFHILFAIDMIGDNVRIITAYRPDSQVCRKGDVVHLIQKLLDRKSKIE